MSRTKIKSEESRKVYYQVAKQGEGYRDDGAGDNPCAWSMVTDCPSQFVEWLNDSDREHTTSNSSVRPAVEVWFRVLTREELATWSRLRELITLRMELSESREIIDELKKALSKEKKS